MVQAPEVLTYNRDERVSMKPPHNDLSSQFAGEQFKQIVIEFFQRLFTGVRLPPLRNSIVRLVRLVESNQKILVVAEMGKKPVPCLGDGVGLPNNLEPMEVDGLGRKLYFFAVRDSRCR